MKKILFLIFLMIGTLSYGQMTKVPMGVGTKLNVAFPIINLVIDQLNRIQLDRINATADEINILHNLDPNLIYIGNIAIITTQVDANLTDNTPTDGEITAALGMTATVAGKNYTRIIKDTNGSGLIYLVFSDGTYWHYIKSTIAS
jgi:hypothetical protein